MAVLYTIRNWDERFEKAQSRKLEHALPWVAIPTKHDGLGFRRIMALEDGMAVYGAWILLLQIAAKCTPRGRLADENGPMDATDFAIKTGGRKEVFDRALNVLSGNKIGWILPTRWEDATSALPLQDSTEQDKTEQDKTGEAASPSLKDPVPDPPADDQPPAPARIKPEDVPVPEALRSDPFLSARIAWFAMRRRKRCSLRPEYVANQFERLLPLGPDLAAACLKYSTDNDYEGIFPERFTRGPAANKLRPGSNPSKSGERGL
jgi:hypothetical protein